MAVLQSSSPQSWSLQGLLSCSGSRSFDGSLLCGLLDSRLDDGSLLDSRLDDGGLLDSRLEDGGLLDSRLEDGGFLGASFGSLLGSSRVLSSHSFDVFSLRWSEADCEDLTENQALSLTCVVLYFCPFSLSIFLPS